MRLVDRVAYINHDIDDALRARDHRAGRPARGRDRAAGADGAARIDTLVRDIVESSREAGDIAQSEDDRRRRCCGCASSCSTASISGPEARGEHERVQRTMRGLFDHYVEHPGEVPGDAADGDELQRVTDYIAGMTDRFCIARFRQLSLPEESRL